MCSLTVCGERKRRAAISRLVEPVRDQRQHLVLALRQQGRRRLGLRREHRHPEPDHPHRPRDVGAPQSLETKPDAPAAFAAAARCGRRRRSAARASPASSRGSPRRARRPTRCRGTGRPARRAGCSAVGQLQRLPPLRAARQRLDPRLPPSSRRKPQWTTSWSSTTSTRRRLSRRRLVAPRQRAHQPHAPALAATGPNSTKPPWLERLERGEPQAQPGAAAAFAGRRRCATSSESAPLAPRRPRPRSPRVGVLADVAQRLRQHRLGERLEPRGTCTPFGQRTLHAVVLSRAGREARRVAGLAPSGARPARARSAGRRAPSSSSCARARSARRSGRPRRPARARAEQALDHVLVDLARQGDPLVEPAACAPAGGSPARGRASAAARPSVHIRWRSRRRARTPPSAVGGDDPEPAAAGRERRADERGDAHQPRSRCGHLLGGSE